MTPPPDRDDRIEAAMVEYSAALGRGRPPDRRAFLAAHPDLAADLAPYLDNIEALHGLGHQVAADAGPARPEAGVVPLARVGEYEVVREVGRGGMGVVYEAVQPSLGRRVAVKVLPDAAARDPRDRARFLREAHTMACLHHPNIVPVYAVGDAEGVPHYAMQLIDGRSLDVVLQAVRHRGAGRVTGEGAGPVVEENLLVTGLAVGFPPVAPEPPAAGPTPVPRSPKYVDTVVRIAHDAARALAYAHGADVLHRDVKPGNLLLDVHGHVWLTDFGLARGLSDPAASEAGTRVGTPQYLPPEVALDRASASARSDVYGLGLTLYELLTLRPAFQAATRSELLRLIESADPTRASTLNPAVPEDLEVVVEKATAKDPADRYESADAFAADLDRVRRGVPVLARRFGGRHRLRRWARRHRRALTGAGISVTGGVVLGLAASSVFTYAAYRDAEARRAQLEARDAALLAFVLDVNRSELALTNVPGAQGEQRDMARAVKALLTDVADEADAGREARWQAYRACVRLVQVESQQGHQPEAMAAAREALARIQGLVRVGATGRADRLELAHAHRLLGGALLNDLQYAAAREQIEAALAVYDRLDADEPGDTRVLNHQSQTRGILARQFAATGDFDAAVAQARRGLAVDEALAQWYPTGHPQSYIRLAQTHLVLARLSSLRGDVAAAEDHHRAACTNDRVVKAMPEAKVRDRFYTFMAAGRYGAFLVGQDRLAEAKPLLDACAREAEELRAAYPTDRAVCDTFVLALAESCRVAALEGRDADAREFARKAVAAHTGDWPLPFDERLVGLPRLPPDGPLDAREPLEVAQRHKKTAASPDRWELNSALGKWRRWDAVGAESGFRRVLTLPNPERWQAGAAQYLLAACLAERGDRAAARSTFAEAELANWHRFATDGRIRIARLEATQALAKVSR